MQKQSQQSYQDQLKLHQQPINNEQQVALNVKQQQQFNFKPQSDDFNIYVMDNLDIEKVYYTQDIISAKTALKNLATCKLLKNLPSTLTYYQYFKIFRVCQLAIEHHSFLQDSKEANIMQLQNKNNLIKQKLSELQKIKNAHDSKKQQIVKQLEHYKKKIEQLKQDSLMDKQFVCQFCTKSFKTEEAKKRHMMKRHNKQYEYQLQFEEVTKLQDNPVYQLKKLEYERKQMQDALHIRQMQELNRMHQREINHREVTTKLQDVLEKDLNYKIQSQFDQGKHLNIPKQKQILEEKKSELKDSIQHLDQMFNNFELIFQDIDKKQKGIKHIQYFSENQLEAIKKQQHLGQRHYYTFKKEFDQIQLDFEIKQLGNASEEQVAQYLSKNYVEKLGDQLYSSKEFMYLQEKLIKDNAIKEEDENEEDDKKQKK